MVNTMESPTGTGAVYIGEEPLGSVSYNLAIQQEMIGPGNRVGGLLSIRGRISGDRQLLLKLSMNPNSVILKLEDGRRLNIIVDSNGSLTADGGFYY